jgi:DNA-directed RNA polymerase subunit omega
MINDLKIDELLEKVDSRYGLVIAGARRARQINEYTATLGLNESLGIPGPQVHTRSQHPLSIAIEELRSGKLEVSFAQPPGEGEEEAGAAGGDDFVGSVGAAGGSEPSAGGGGEAPVEASTDETPDDDPSEDSSEDQGAA